MAQLLLLLAELGILATATSMATFLQHNNTPIMLRTQLSLDGVLYG